MPGRNALGVEAGRAIKRGWASQYSLGEPVLGEPSNEVGRASTKGPLGEPVLIGRTRIGRAIKRGWGEPSNKVGRASTKGPLGEPVLNFHSGLHTCFKAAPAWRGAYSACSARLVPARHCACSARLVPARHV